MATEKTDAQSTTELTLLRRKVAELERIQEENRSRNEAFYSFIEHVDDIIWELNANFEFTYVSPAVRRLGYQPQDLLGRHLFSFLTGESIAAVKSMLPAPGTLDVSRDRSGKRLVVEVGFVDKEGNSTQCEVVPSGRFDEKGTLVCYQGVTRVIIERIQAEQALRESEARFRNIFEESRLGIITVDSSFCFSSANPAFCSMLGYTQEELSSLTFEDVTHPDCLEADRAGVASVIRGERPHYRTEKKYIRKDGGIVWGSVTATVIRDKQGGFLYFLTMVEDITERKRAEEHKARLEDQLRHAQKMEAIGTLAGGVAHDFNNLLTVILGFANLIQMGTGPGDRVRPYADQIVISANKAAELTRSLLAFSRKQLIDLKPHRLNEVVKSTARLLERLLPEDIQIRLDLSDRHPAARLDVTQIDQVLMNLATNGRDAMPAGGVFTLKTEIVDLDETFKEIYGFGAPGPYALLSVSDTGVGMDQRTIGRIFDPFFTTKEIGKGTGLGLASTYGIVKQHGGYITVASELSKGTTFEIYLPLAQDVDGGDVRPTEELASGSETVLVVEDDRAVRDMITSALKPHGYKVFEAADGYDAIKAFKGCGQKVDLVLLDVVMPGKNGKDALNEIAKIKPSVKAIFMSGYTGDVIVDKGLGGQAIDFLQKPLSIPKLLAKIREVLDKR